MHNESDKNIQNSVSKCCNEFLNVAKTSKAHQRDNEYFLRNHVFHFYKTFTFKSLNFIFFLTNCNGLIYFK